MCCRVVQVVGLNLSATFVNPSDTDSCERYVMQSRNYLTQVGDMAAAAGCGMSLYCCCHIPARVGHVDPMESSLAMH